MEVGLITEVHLQKKTYRGPRPTSKVSLV